MNYFDIIVDGSEYSGNYFAAKAADAVIKVYGMNSVAGSLYNNLFTARAIGVFAALARNISRIDIFQTCIQSDLSRPEQTGH